MMVTGFGALEAAIRLVPKRFDTTKAQSGPSAQHRRNNPEPIFIMQRWYKGDGPRAASKDPAHSEPDRQVTPYAMVLHPATDLSLIGKA
jgi:hypothetical protein